MFLFTCHESLAAEACAGLGARAVALGRLDGARLEQAFGGFVTAAMLAGLEPGESLEGS